MHDSLPRGLKTAEAGLQAGPYYKKNTGKQYKKNNEQ